MPLLNYFHSLINLSFILYENQLLMKLSSNYFIQLAKFMWKHEWQGRFQKMLQAQNLLNVTQNRLQQKCFFCVYSLSFFEQLYPSIIPTTYPQGFCYHSTSTRSQFHSQFGPHFFFWGGGGRGLSPTRCSPSLSPAAILCNIKEKK